MTQPDATALARKFIVEVNTGTFDVPVWTLLAGITEWNPKFEPTLQEAGAYEDEGWTGSQKTALKGTAEVTFLRRKSAAGAYNIAQESLRLKALLFGSDGQADVRWYDRDGGDEAYQGRFETAWERANSGTVDLDAAKVTLTAVGKCETIANPS